MVSEMQWKPFNAGSSELMRRMNAEEWATSDIVGGNDEKGKHPTNLQLCFEASEM